MDFPTQSNPASVRQQRGFTLIEIMVVVAIVAILAAVAYPSYEDAQRRSRRADAQSDLMQLAQFSEKFFTENIRYDQDRGGTAYPLPFNRSPRSGGAVRYNITFASTDGSGQTYVLTATPVGSQASDACGTLTINQLGVTTPTAGTDGRACW